jgi:hypothetical protein
VLFGELVPPDALAPALPPVFAPELTRVAVAGGVAGGRGTVGVPPAGGGVVTDRVAATDRGTKPWAAAPLTGVAAVRPACAGLSPPPAGATAAGRYKPVLLCASAGELCRICSS